MPAGRTLIHNGVVCAVKVSVKESRAWQLESSVNISSLKSPGNEHDLRV